MKHFNLPFDYILHDISFNNLALLIAAIPKYEPENKLPSEEELMMDLFSDT